MKVEVRRPDSDDRSLILIPENQEESRMIDSVLGGGAGTSDGLIANVQGQVRLADGYGTHYIALRPPFRVQDARRLDITIGEILKLAEDSNAAVTQIVHRGPPGCEPKDDETPFIAFILVRGIPETGRMIGAIEEEQTRWELEG